jgi:hypothetical protein
MGVATAIAIAGIAVSAASAGASFAAAAKQRKLQKEAQDQAAAAMKEAKDRLNVNYFDVLSINKEPYELQREAALAQGAQTVEAARESDRGAGAGAGRIQMAQNQMQAGIRSSMGEDMQKLDKLKVTEDARLAQMQAAINLEEVRGAQQAAADAQKAAAMANEQGWEKVGKLGGQITTTFGGMGGGGGDATGAKSGGGASNVVPNNNGLAQNPPNNPQQNQQLRPAYNSQGFPMQQQSLYSQNPFQINWLSPPTYQESNN